MELVKRYIAAVQRELPETKRDEIGRELNANIMDQLDALREQQGELTDTAVADVLQAMGHPRKVAQQFVPPTPLVSPGYMTLYKHTLFMVLGILFLLQVVDSTSALLRHENMGLLSLLHGLASGFIEDCMLAFSSITLAFWLMSRQNPTAEADCSTRWHPAKLPAATASWQHISLQDVFTDLATYLFLLIVIWYPLWMSVEQLASSRFLLTTQSHQLLQWASPLVLLGIINSLWQLKQRLWSRAMLLANVLLNSGFVVVILMLAASSPLLQLEPGQWRGVFDLAQIERAAVTGLVITAMFPLWEVLRDVWRLTRAS